MYINFKFKYKNALELLSKLKGDANRGTTLICTGVRASVSMNDSRITGGTAAIYRQNAFGAELGKVFITHCFRASHQPAAFCGAFE